MSVELVLFPATIVLSLVGIYLNLCYQRATHRSTVYARFLCRNLRFLSLAQICLAFSNIVFTAAVWGSRVNRTKKTEAFFSTTLSLTRALPAATVFWVTVERVMYNRVPTIRDSTKFRYIAVFRMVQLMASIIVELVIRSVYDTSNSVTSSDAPSSSNSSDAPEIRDVIKSSLISNVYFDFYHGILFVISILISLFIFNMTSSSHKRAGLLGGMRNDQKIQNLKSQITFFKHSFLPLYAGCLSDFLLQVLIKRVLTLDDATQDIAYIACRAYLPIVYPVSLIICHQNLRADYVANFFLCRKARNLHKESKVKVIATRESQESIIANLKMIGILSDVDAVPPGGPVPLAGPKVSRVSISKDPVSNTSLGSMAKMSTGSMGGGGGATMMFTTRPRNGLPSIGSVG